VVTRLLVEIRELGYPGSVNLLVRPLKQGRADPKRTPPSPRRLVSCAVPKTSQTTDAGTRTT
jgi:hypothetical protein